MSTPLVRDTLATLEKNVDRAEALVADLSDEQLSWKPAPDVFSVRENIWHMRDIDFDGYLLRVEQTLTKRHPILPDLDGLALAQERRYNELPIGPALQELRYARARARQLFDRITENDLRRTATFETVGEVTVADLPDPLARSRRRSHLGSRTAPRIADRQRDPARTARVADDPTRLTLLGFARNSDP